MSYKPNNWILCKNEMPKLSERVLVQSKDGLCFLAILATSNYFMLCETNVEFKIDVHDIVAWASIPDSIQDVNAFEYTKWLLEREPDGKPYCLHCLNCDYDFKHIGIKVAYNYCPNCGNKMITDKIYEYINDEIVPSYKVSRGNVCIL